MNPIRRLLSWLQRLLLGSPSQLPVRIFRQNVYTMVNSLTFSTEMDTLFLIDNGRAIAFPLDNNKGILIGTLKGQLTVATDFQAPPTKGEGLSVSSAQPLALSANGKETKLDFEKTVWSAAYHKRNLTLCFVGATEVEIRKGGTEVDYKPEIAFFDLSRHVLSVQRKGNAILLKSLVLHEEEETDA